MAALGDVISSVPYPGALSAFSGVYTLLNMMDHRRRSSSASSCHLDVSDGV